MFTLSWCILAQDRVGLPLRVNGLMSTWSSVNLDVPWTCGVDQEARRGGSLTWWAPSCSPCRAGTCGVWGWAWWPRPGSAARPAAPGRGPARRSGAGTRNRQTTTCYNGLHTKYNSTRATTGPDTSYFSVFPTKSIQSEALDYILM